MLKRLYVHNYKCLVNFEINFDQDISLFLGANGSGKSTVFEVLRKVTDFILGERRVWDVFYQNDFTRWSLDTINEESTSIIIELDIEKNGIYKYRLELGFSQTFVNRNNIFIKDEKLIINSENIELIDRNSLFKSVHSGISRCYQADTFRQHLQELFVVRINPYQMTATINQLNDLALDLSNFSEWFSYLNETNRRGVSKLENAMRDVFIGFDYFRIEQAGRAKVLQIDFEDKASKKVITYYFDELSEGQKALIALYTLIYCIPDNSIICIDEPENFLALPEIQPWFDTLYDQCAERNLQVLLISHHPKIINLLASDSGYWFSRENNLTRIQKISPEDESGLSIAELIERGWIYEH